jgi:hypothetical protein
MTDPVGTITEGTGTEPAAGTAPAPAATAAGTGTEPQTTATDPQTSTVEPSQEGGDSAGESDKQSTDKGAGHKGLLVAEDESKPEGDELGTLGAPEGDYEVKAPEGGVLDPTVMGELGAVARELNLSPAAVQKLVDRVAPVWQKQGLAHVEKFRKEWTEQSLADKEFGGNGFDANIKAVNKAYTKFTTPELRTLLEESGLNCHPEVIRHFYRLSKATEDGRYIKGTGNGSIPSGDIRNFYKGMNP